MRFFLDKALAGDEFAISIFAGEMFQVDVPFTANLKVVREAVTGWKAYGTTALHDAVARMPQISLEGRNPKRFALLITDGVDNASRLTPEQARAIVQDAQLPTYVLGLGSGNPMSSRRRERRSIGTRTCSACWRPSRADVTTPSRILSSFRKR